jgi:hypothetical protein
MLFRYSLIRSIRYVDTTIPNLPQNFHCDVPVPCDEEK